MLFKWEVKGKLALYHHANKEEFYLVDLEGNKLRGKDKV